MCERGERSARVVDGERIVAGTLHDVIKLSPAHPTPITRQATSAEGKPVEGD